MRGKIWRPTCFWVLKGVVFWGKLGQVWCSPSSLGVFAPAWPKQPGMPSLGCNYANEQTSGSSRGACGTGMGSINRL